MNENRYLEERRKELGGNIWAKRGQGDEMPPKPFEDSLVSEYEQKNGVPYIIDKLGLRTEFHFDKQIEMKARSIEESILDILEEEKARGGRTSYDTIFERFRLPEPLERMMQNKQGIKVLDIIFSEIALRNKMSSKSFLSLVEEKLKNQRINNLLGQLEQSLAII